MRNVILDPDRDRRSRRARPRRLAAAVLTVGLIAGVGHISAAPVASGAEMSAVDVDMTAKLPRFPCYWQHGPCTGVLQGELGGALTGDLPDASWSVTLADAPLTGTFAYVHGVDCTMSPGYGSLSATAGNTDGVVVGSILSDGGVVREVNGLKLDADFNWQQAGFGVSAFLANVEISLHVAGEGWTQVASGLWGTGSTSYVPDLPVENPFDCSWMMAGDPPPADVLMAGSILLSDA